MNQDIVGTTIGIYNVLYECNYKAKNGKKLYHVQCTECGFEQDMMKSSITKAKLCRHYPLLTKEQIQNWYDKNKKECLWCGEYIPFDMKAGISDYRTRKFCSQSCAASYNNKNAERKAYFCMKCGQLLGYGYEDFQSKRLCDNCNPCIVDWGSVMYGDLKNGKKTAHANGRIRDLARNLYRKSDKPKQCMNCGYDKHYEVCHIKGISTFSDDTPISEINNLDNLIALCPNCHWELDNGLLDL